MPKKAPVAMGDVSREKPLSFVPSIVALAVNRGPVGVMEMNAKSVLPLAFTKRSVAHQRRCVLILEKWEPYASRDV